VRRTAGAVLWYEGRPAEAVFHADCGGHTSAAVRVWGGTTAPYLRAVRDDGPAAAAHAAWVFEAGFDEVRDALNADPRTRVGARLDWIRIVERDEAGRVALAAVQGERHPMVTGDVLRDVLSRTFGSRSIRSTWFDVARDGSRLRFSGRGFGHGVGLCQAGALARIRAGARPAEVLAVYFPGTTIAPLQP
jgi:stage II sporulation protein D